MRWLLRLSQRFTDTQDWANQYLRNNPEHQPQFEVYQAPPPFDHVFLGGEDDYAEAQALAGEPICSTVDCRDLPEIDPKVIDGERDDWGPADFATVQQEFDATVNRTIQKIQSTNCPIFVYCVLGANRSVSVLAAALAQLTNQPLNTILSNMKQSRNFVNPSDPYYLMALLQSPSETPEFKQQKFDELDQDWSHDWPDLTTAQIPEDFPDDLLFDMDLLHQEKQWRRAVSTPGSLVTHNDYGWTGKVIKVRGNPVRDGTVLVEYPLSAEEAEHLGADEGYVVQRFHRALSLSPTMQLASPFRRASLNWLQKVAQEIPPWTQTWEEFIDYHKTGNISHGYGAEGQGLDLSNYNDHNKKQTNGPDKYPILIDTKTFKVPRYGEVEVEFRQSNEESKYVKTGPADESGYSDIVRDEQGLATYYSPEEMKQKDLPSTSTTIHMFSGGLGIGHVGESFGATELFVVREFQGGGIGSYILKLYMQMNPTKSHKTPQLGQMTWQGIATAKKAWMSFVEEAITNGKNVPNNVIASYQQEKQDRVDNPPQRVDYDIPKYKTNRFRFSSGEIPPLDGFNSDILIQMGIKFWDVETDQSGRPQRWRSDEGATWENAVAFVENLGYQAEEYRTYNLKMDYSGAHGVILPANA